LGQEVSYVNFIIWLFFTEIPLDQPSQLGRVETTSTSLFFYLSVRLSLNMPNWPGHIETISTWFVFKLRLNKKLGLEVSYVNFILWISFTRIPLDQPSQLGRVRTTSTSLNFKLELDEESDQKVSRLTCKLDLIKISNSFIWHEYFLLYLRISWFDQ